MKRDRGGDDLLEPSETSLGDDEAAGVVRQRHYAEKANYECERRQSNRECGACDCRDGHRRSKKKTTAPPERAELRRETKSVAVVAYAHTRYEREPHANVIAVGHDYVIEVLEL